MSEGKAACGGGNWGLRAQFPAGASWDFSSGGVTRSGEVRAAHLMPL